MTSPFQTPSAMQAVEISAPGGPEVLREIYTAVPEPSVQDVLIAVYAAGVNRPDCMQRAGRYPLPEGASPLPGLEVAGEIVFAGSAVSRWKIGDHVVALTHGGGYAGFCAVNAEHCLPWPENLDAAQAAALPETCFTVHHNLVARGGLKRDETVLIHGGSSGIGTTAIQIAKAIGARTIVTAGTRVKCDYCIRMGADYAINYRDEDWEGRVREILPAGVDVVLDMVGGDYVMKNINVLASDGRYVMIAFMRGAKAEVDFWRVLPKRLTLCGSTLRPQSSAQKASIARAVERDIWPLVRIGSVRPHIHQTFPLAQASAAHSVMEASTHMGKLVLNVGNRGMSIDEP